MKNNRKGYEVFEEIISPDNVMRMGELLALQSLKFMCQHKHLHRMYANLARDIDYKDIPGYVLTDSYDLAQSAALFLLDYMGKSVYDTCIDKKSNKVFTIKRFIMQKEIEIDKEKLKNYTHLSLDDIKQYLKSVIYENADKKLISKLIINTFIREVIYYPDRIIITYNFTDKNDRPKVTKEYLEQIEKQSENSQAVYSFPISSSILNFGAPVFESLVLRQKNQRDVNLSIFLSLFPRLSLCCQS